MDKKKTESRKHLTFEERKKIEVGLNSGMSPIEISHVLHRSRQTIYNELERGRKDLIKSDGSIVKIYLAEFAQQTIENELKSSQKQREKSDEIYQMLLELLKKGEEAKGIYYDLQKQFGESAPSQATTYRWIKKANLEINASENYLRNGDQAYILGDFGFSLSCYQTGAKKGDSNCMNALAWQYYRGYGTERNLRLAFKWFKKSAELKNSESMWMLGYFFDNGLGTLKSLNNAFFWYLQSAELGNVNGEVYLAWYYEHGTAMTRSIREALHWYHAAAGHGSLYAMDWLTENEEKCLESMRKDTSQTVEEWSEYFEYAHRHRPSVSDLEIGRQTGELSEQL